MDIATYGVGLFTAARCCRAFAHTTIPELRAPHALRGRKDHAIVGAAIAVGEHAPDRMIAIHVHAHLLRVPELVADVEIDTFAHDQHAVAVDLDGLPGLAFHRKGRVGKPRHCDLARRRELETEIVGLADIRGKVAA